ncbi:MAG: DinB family protein [Actinomycetota bacterium]
MTAEPAHVELDEVVAALVALPDVLATLLEPIPHEALAERPEPGEWCVLEVIGHLVACDAEAFRDRIVAIARGDGVVAPFRPWAAIEARDLAAEPLGSLLDELRSERAVSAELLATLTPDELAVVGTFRDGRRFAAGDFVHEWPYHDRDHLQQILEILKVRQLGPMTPVMRSALTDG